MEQQLDLLIAFNAWTLTLGGAGLLLLYLSLIRDELTDSAALDLRLGFGVAAVGVLLWAAASWIPAVLGGVHPASEWGKTGIALADAIVGGTLLWAGRLLSAGSGKRLRRTLLFGWSTYAAVLVAATAFSLALPEDHKAGDVFRLMSLPALALGLGALGVGLVRNGPAGRAGLAHKVAGGGAVACVAANTAFVVILVREAGPLAIYFTLLVLLFLKLFLLLGLTALARQLVERAHASRVARALEDMTGPLSDMLRNPDRAKESAPELLDACRRLFRPGRARLWLWEATAEGRELVRFVADDAKPAQRLGELPDAPWGRFRLGREPRAVGVLEVLHTSHGGSARVVSESAEQLIERVWVAQQRDDLFAGLAHELRKPYATILQRASKLRSDLGRGRFTPERGVRGLDAVLDQCRLGATLIGDWEATFQAVLDDRPLETELLDVRALAEELADEFRGAAAGRAGVLRTELPDGRLMVRGQEMLLRQALANLLDNAVKYGIGRRGEVVELSVRRAPDEGRVLIEVADRGPGLDPADLPRLFQPLQRGRRVSTTHPGSGMGLYFARAIVRKHGGELLHRPTASEEPRGVTFTVLLDIARGLE